ncbi:MAG: hypothetical protein A3K05_02065 [Candidatus Doudnabacteria bacterium RIFCSPHIGHO2_01_48_18]|nr:MAG: hypothetical protein A3K05_02065 [Candidatus Doudnabacteria bacterium RIFCSPHIGHO2_01_48_18]
MAQYSLPAGCNTPTGRSGFIFIHKDKDYLADMISQIDKFLRAELKLGLHPQKIILRKLSQGIDFLGYVILPYHRVLRTKTKRRMFRKVNEKVRDWESGQTSRKSLEQALQSYFGMLKPCRAWRSKQELKLKRMLDTGS